MKIKHSPKILASEEKATITKVCERVWQVAQCT